MTGYLKAGAAVVALALAFGGGYRYAAALYAKDMANYRAEQAAATQRQETAFRAAEQENAKRLVRQSASRAAESGKMSGACSSAVKPYQQRLASCTDLLLESAQLLREGADLAGRTAADKEALIQIRK